MGIKLNEQGGKVNVKSPTMYSLDETLSKEGYGADAAAVGEFVNKVKEFTKEVDKDFEDRDKEINRINSNIATIKSNITSLNTNKQDKNFIAEYGVTTYEELLNAYEAKKQLVLRIPAETVGGVPEIYANLMSYSDNSFNFVCLNWSNIQYRFYAYRNNNDTVWKYSKSTLAEYAYAKIIDDNFKNYVKTTNNTLNNYNMNINSLFKLVYGFRGGFCNNAGTLHIKNPGIYLIMQGGTGNKQIIINQPEGKALDATWNGVIVLAYEGGVVTPIGIESSLTIAGAFKMPGTFQGWTPDGKYSTTINYPAKCVVAYLGNRNVDYLSN